MKPAGRGKKSSKLKPQVLVTSQEKEPAEGASRQEMAEGGEEMMSEYYLWTNSTDPAARPQGRERPRQKT